MSSIAFLRLVVQVLLSFTDHLLNTWSALKHLECPPPNIFIVLFLFYNPRSTAITQAYTLSHTHIQFTLLKRRKSLKNKKIRWSIPPIVMPDNPVCCLTSTARVLTANTNNSWDKWHPLWWITADWTVLKWFY